MTSSLWSQMRASNWRDKLQRQELLPARTMASSQLTSRTSANTITNTIAIKALSTIIARTVMIIHINMTERSIRTAPDHQVNSEDSTGEAGTKSVSAAIHHIDLTYLVHKANPVSEIDSHTGEIDTHPSIHTCAICHVLGVLAHTTP